MACQYSGKKWILHEKEGEFLVFDAMFCAEFAENLLKSRCNYVISELELYRLSQKKK